VKAFVDASFAIAIIAGEPECDEYIDRLFAARPRLWSAMSCWEIVAGLRNNHQLSLEDASTELAVFRAAFEMELVPVGAAELPIALEAYRQYGKGQGSPARLNFGDCFSYACKTTHSAKLFYKGDDFAQTDAA
jgi:ribonuclease VapC